MRTDRSLARISLRTLVPTSDHRLPTANNAPFGKRSHARSRCAHPRIARRSRTGRAARARPSRPRGRTDSRARYRAPPPPAATPPARPQAGPTDLHRSRASAPRLSRPVTVTHTSRCHQHRPTTKSPPQTRGFFGSNDPDDVAELGQTLVRRRSAVYVSSRRYAKGSRHAVTAEIHTTRRSRRGAARWLARYCSRPLASAQVDRRTTGTDEQRERRSRPPLSDGRRSLGASLASVARCSLGRLGAAQREGRSCATALSQ